MDNKHQTLSYKNEAGFSLFIVLIMMVVIAFLVISTMQSTTMDSRTSANDSDYQLAMQNAQRGLWAGEEEIRNWEDNSSVTHLFSCTCQKGLCAAKKLTSDKVGSNKQLSLEACEKPENLQEVWLRPNVLTGTENDVSFPLKAEEADKEASKGRYYRFVIEYMGKNSDSKFLFRITAKGWGRNASTVAMVQEVVEATIPFLNSSASHGNNSNGGNGSNPPAASGN